MFGLGTIQAEKAQKFPGAVYKCDNKKIKAPLFVGLTVKVSTFQPFCDSWQFKHLLVTIYAKSFATCIESHNG